MSDMFVKAIRRTVGHQLLSTPPERNVHLIRVFVHTDKRLEEVLMGLADSINGLMHPEIEIKRVDSSRAAVIVLNQFKEKEGIEVDVFLLPAADPDHLYFRYDCKAGHLIFIDDVLRLPNTGLKENPIRRFRGSLVNINELPTKDNAVGDAYILDNETTYIWNGKEWYLFV